MASSLHIAIVVSQFNADITDALLQGAKTRLIEKGVSADRIDVHAVPGAVEIPLVAKLLAKRGEVDAIICLGCVIRGETTHYDFVCEQVSVGCQDVMMQYELPVIFGVLTTESRAQAQARVGGEKGHKGIYCADAALSMCALLGKLK